MYSISAEENTWEYNSGILRTEFFFCWPVFSIVYLKKNLIHVFGRKGHQISNFFLK